MAKLGCGSTDMIATAAVLSAKLLALLLYGNERTTGGRLLPTSNVACVGLHLPEYVLQFIEDYECRMECVGSPAFKLVRNEQQ